MNQTGNEARGVLLSTFFQILGKFVNAFLSLLTVRILTNTLSKGEYGDYITLFEFMGFFGIAADFGLFTIAVREMSAHPRIKKKIFGNILSIRLILIAFFCVLAGILGGIVFREKTYMQLGIWIISLTTTMTLLAGTFTAVLQTHLQMGKAAIAAIFSKLISFSLIYYFSLQFDGIKTFYDYLWAGTWGALGMLILVIIFVSRISSFSLRFDFDFWKETIKKSLPYGLALILTQIYFKIDIQMIYFLRGDTEAGIYGISVRIIEALSLFAIFFMNSVMPILSPALRRNKEKAKKIVQYSFNFLFLISAPMLFGAPAVSRDLISLIGNEDYLSHPGFWGSDWILNFLIIAMCFSYLGIVFEFLLIALGKQKKLLLINFIGVSVNLILNFIFIPSYGILAAAITSIVCEMLVMALKLLFSMKDMEDFSLETSSAQKILFSALAMGFAVFFLREKAGFIASIFLSALLYFFLIFMTRAIDKEFLRRLRS